MDRFSFADFIVAVGLAFTLEGILFLGFPEHVQRMLAKVAASPAQQLRIAGIISAVVGLGLVWMMRA